jgi:hypothetical protein
MLKFTTASIADGNLVVTGPADPGSGLPVKHLRFLVAQGDAMVENDAFVSGDEWRGEAPAGDLKPGPAHGVGLAVMISAGSPGSYETRTWVEPITLT